MAPQHERLNRSWWLALETWERKIATAHGRVTGFSGPVFSDADEPFRGEVELEDGLVAHDTFHVPRAYWKVVTTGAPGGRVRHAAFLMDQVAMVDAGVGRQIDLADYRVPLERLEQVARLSFSQRLHDSAELDR